MTSTILRFPSWKYVTIKLRKAVHYGYKGSGCVIVIFPSIVYLQKLHDTLPREIKHLNIQREDRIRQRHRVDTEPDVSFPLFPNRSFLSAKRSLPFSFLLLFPFPQTFHHPIILFDTKVVTNATLRFALIHSKEGYKIPLHDFYFISDPEILLY